MTPLGRRPTRPGRILFEDFLKPLHITQTALAARMRVPLQRVNTLINGKRSVTAETAILLSEILGTSPEFWLNLQMASDLYAATKKRRARTG